MPSTQTQQGGLMVTKDTRFKQQKNEVPGPGNYEVRCAVEPKRQSKRQTKPQPFATRNTSQLLCEIILIAHYFYFS